MLFQGFSDHEEVEAKKTHTDMCCFFCCMLFVVYAAINVQHPVNENFHWITG